MLKWSKISRNESWRVAGRASQNEHSMKKQHEKLVLCKSVVKYEGRCV